MRRTTKYIIFALGVILCACLVFHTEPPKETPPKGFDFNVNSLVKNPNEILISVINLSQKDGRDKISFELMSSDEVKKLLKNREPFPKTEVLSVQFMTLSELRKGYGNSSIFDEAERRAKNGEDISLFRIVGK